jgi:hypothetical protein
VDVNYAADLGFGFFVTIKVFISSRKRTIQDKNREPGKVSGSGAISSRVPVLIVPNLRFK